MNKPTTSYPNVAQSWGIIGMLILSMLLLSPIIIVLSAPLGKELAAFTYYIFTFGLPLIIILNIRKKKTGGDTFNFALTNKRVIPLIIVATGGLLFGISAPIMSLIPIPEFVKKIFEEMANQTGFFSFMTIVIAAPILEEVIMRGIILDGLLKRYSPVKSILFSSFLFGLLHLNPWQFVLAMILGTFAGWVYYRTRSLALPILIHATNNLFAFSMRYVMQDVPVDTSFAEMFGGLMNAFLVISVAILLTLLSIYFLKKEFSKGKAENQLTAETV